MYNTGVTGFLAVASNPNRNIDTRATLNTSQGTGVLTPDDIVSYKISAASVAGKYFTPGNFIATTLEMSLNAFSTEVSKIDFKTEIIHSLSVDAGIRVTQMVYVPMGIFYLDDDGISTEDSGHVTIKATNLPPVLKGTFSSSILALPCTIQDALAKISAATGVTINASAEDFPNLLVSLKETFALSSTYS